MHKQWGTATTAFGDGRWLLGVGGVVQALALLLPFVGIVYTLGRLGTRMGRRSWAWSADSAAKRVLVVVTGAGLLLLLVRAWLPGPSYTPIRPGERGTLTDYVAASETVLRRDGTTPAYVPSGVAADLGSSPATPARDVGSGSVVESPAPSESPSAVTGVAPSESAAPSESPTPEVSMSPSDSASVTP
jgi:hypothetical protein